LIGPAGFLPFRTAFLAGFADLRIIIEDLIEEGDRVAVRWRATGTLTGHGMGFAPTGRPMTITGMTIARVQNGQIIEGWNNFDVLGMHQQLGTLAVIAGM
jgi:predicted ester cyclase